MKTLTELNELDQLIAEQPGLVVLFGGEHCGVCQVIKPKLEMMLSERYPLLQMVYIDCQQSQSLCAQKSVFSLPVVQVYFDRQRFIEKARSFSLAALLDEIERPYALLFNTAE
ncbi:thioredoxin family protein [Thiomicrospira sp.]|uniref:thioredoxin family protein n=1 Tax=Thiomicrospira sp. TaxID=935 RepID=UPI002F951E2A